MKVHEDYYKESFDIALQRLQRKCEYFDEGDEDIAIDMAVQIRVLVHDTQNSTSLIKHLWLKDNLKMITTSISNYKEGISFCVFESGLCNSTVIQNDKPRYALMSRHIAKDAKVEYKPLLGRNRKDQIDFENWWKEEIAITDQGTSLSRKDVVLTLCHKDGGAHFDDMIDSKYMYLKRNDVVGMYINGTKSISSTIPLYTIVRQITYEVIESLSHLNSLESLSD